MMVVETSNCSKAACDLDLSQPTVTKHIAFMEQALGARFLDRNAWGISLPGSANRCY